MAAIPELITNVDMLSPENAFMFQKDGGKYPVSAMVRVIVPRKYKYDSAKIVICAFTDPDNGIDLTRAFVVSNDYNAELDGSYTILASGSCKLEDEDVEENNKWCSISNLVLELKPNQKNLLFTNEQIVNITGTEGADTIYIVSYGTNGVSDTATLDFSQGGTDTIKFDGATTVQNISGGGQTGVHLL